ncbi:MAG TPA: hypothetical protein VME43_15565 [Bryobacteraceae bacterium]|nr:hypothetical protein [Bryobacteraceae bacterium]
MAKNAATHPSPAPSSASQPADSRPALAPVIEINVRHIGRTPQPEKLTGSEVPEGWIRGLTAELWKTFSAVKVASWGKKMREDMKYLFDSSTSTCFLPSANTLPQNHANSASVAGEQDG